METQIIFIYCLADTVLKSYHIHDDPQCLMSSAEVITFTLTSTLFYQCNYRLTHLVVRHYRYFPKLLSRSRLMRRIQKIPQHIWLIMFIVCRNFLTQNKCKEFIVDSFPFAVCQNHKIFKCKLLKNKTYHGYTASKKSYFFGIKVHMIVDLNGIPIEFHFTPGSTSDVKALKNFSFDLDKGSKIYADRAYNDYKYEDLLMESTGIKLIPKRKLNSLRKNNKFDDFFLRFHRNRIETTFSSITSLMPRYIRAKTKKGFFLKIFLFVLAFVVKRLTKEY